MTSQYQIRRMSRHDVDLAIEWATGEGWNPGVQDATCFHAADPDGFLVGILDDEPIATISVVKYDASFGFLGLYIVKPPYRGQGHGIALWNAGLARLAGCTIGLDGVVEQQPNYRKSGFDLAYRNVRYEGVRAHEVAIKSGIVPAADVEFEELNAYDRSVFGVDRARFLRGWLSQRNAHAVAITEGASVAGYGVIRPAHRGFKIGPLFADDPQNAEAIFDALVAAVPVGETIVLDTPEVNVAAVALAERNDMRVAFETARMYAGRAPAVAVERVFGVTTFELG
jgi:GNAT superfamily N-acetyltransferase